MLETPLEARFQGEGRRLLVAPPEAYLNFVRAVMLAGAVAIALGIAPNAPFGLPQSWWLFVGLMVLGAATLAYLSLNSVRFDLKEGTYARRQGPGLLPHVYRGRLADLDALVLVSEPGLAGLAVTYHLVLHWKGGAPPLVLRSEPRQLAPGMPLNAAAGGMQALGLQFAQALRVPFYDNAHLPGSNPVPLLRQ
jgi:hypothetical protein